jgi:SnoaL-like protein
MVRPAQLWTVIMIALAGCHAQTRGDQAGGAVDRAFKGISGTSWTWLETECSDGPVDLAQLGFERRLGLVVNKGALELTFDTELQTQGCTSTAVWLAKPGSSPDLWRLEPQAIVTLPADAKCGAAETEATEGSINAWGDQLELTVRKSQWCRGFDARFVFRRAEPARLTPAQVVMRYTAAFNRRDPDAMAGLFVDTGALVEPFTRTDDGNYKRHEGRAEVRAWYASAFATAQWLALRLLAIEPGAAEGQVTARWDYMDARLAEPLHGRNLFVIAGGEIYESELQLLDDPKEKPDAAATVSAGSGGTP